MDCICGCDQEHHDATLNEPCLYCDCDGFTPDKSDG